MIIREGQVPFHGYEILQMDISEDPCWNGETNYSWLMDTSLEPGTRCQSKKESGHRSSQVEETDAEGDESCRAETR